MTTWIVTTGTSDIQLNTEDNWKSLYDNVRYDLPLADCDEFSSCLVKDKENNLFPAPARVLGIVYGNQPDYYQDLEFPLLKTFCEYFDKCPKESPTKIVVLLTDQAGIFQEDQIIYKKCPYWQDTCTLEPLFKKYFKDKFKVEPLFLTLNPKLGKGIDHWNDTLHLVENTLQNAGDILGSEFKQVYVSHQAGTPAISSAVQFVTLGRFKKISFLVSNHYFDENYDKKSEAQLIQSSNYWRGIQIQKAKKLITDGFPGAALNVLEGIEEIQDDDILELKKLIDFFNLHSFGRDISKNFEVAESTQRIVNALELIGFFFKQQNYLQGITLLAAAQETFLKTAVFSQIANIDINIPNKGKASELITWNNAGLYLKDERMRKISDKDDVLKEMKIEILKQVNYPTSDTFLIEKGFPTNSNNGLLKWLRQLKPDFQPWALLEWSCKYHRNHEDDLRNQLMHNLRGVEDSDVIKYLSGDKETDITDVLKVYNDNVKQHFLSSLQLLRLPYTREKLYHNLQKLANSIS